MQPVTRKCNIRASVWPTDKAADSLDPDTLGSFLRSLRQTCNLGLAATAQAAGVHRVTLYRWEQGESEPRLIELNALLEVLSASEAQKRQALILMEAARARMQVRTAFRGISERAGIGPMPDGGDLLQAMRLRCGLSREEVAAKIGVSTRTLRRWEEGDIWPPAERLHALCFTLNAHDDELVALTVGRFAPTPSRFVAPDESPAALAERFRVFQEADTPSPSPVEESLRDLRFLAFESQAWTLAARDEAACGVLANMYAFHATHCYIWGHFDEATEKADRVLEIGAAVPLPTRSLVRAGIVGAYGAVYRVKRPAPRHGIERLRQWAEIDMDIVYRAWLLSDMANYMVLEGQSEAASDFAARAMDITKDSDPLEQALRRRDAAKILLRIGRPGPVLDLLADALNYPFPRMRVKSVFVIVEALQMLGDTQAAQSLLNQMITEMNAIDQEPHNWDPLRKQARELTQRL